MNAEENIQHLLSWIRDNTPSHLPALIPISGGTDSGLCFWAYNQALPGRVLGVYIGEHLKESEWFTGVGTVRVLELLHTLPDAEVMRWAQLLQLSLDEQRILVGTRNRTEDILGIFSHASRVAAHLPLTGLWKSDIIDMCTHIGMPAEILQASREADPVCGRPEELAKISFVAVDSFLKEKLGEQSTVELEPDQRTYLESLYTRHSFKHALPVRGE